MTTESVLVQSCQILQAMVSIWRNVSCDFWPLSSRNVAVSSRVNAPTKVNVNTYLRSIDKIDDYKMVTDWRCAGDGNDDEDMFQEYSVQLTFRQSWPDPRLSYPNHDGETNTE